MALTYGLPRTDNLLCSNIVCREKATSILHMKDKTEKLFCSEHFPMLEVGSTLISHVETLKQPGERNVHKPTTPQPGDA